MEDPKVFEKVFNKVVKPEDFTKLYLEERRRMKKAKINVKHLKIDTPDESEYRKKWFFKKNKAFSVIRGFGTFGAAEGLFECAIVKNQPVAKIGGYKTAKEYDVLDNLVKTGEVTEVQGHLTSEQVLARGMKVMGIK